MSRTRSHLTTAIAGGLIAALLVMTLPVLAGDGDFLVLGEKNTARRRTKVTTKGGFVFRNVRADTPAAEFEVVSGPPFAVNSSETVSGLSADLLDGMEAAAFLGVTEQAADSDLLDGLEAADLAPADHRHAELWYWDNDEVTVPHTGDDLALATLEITNPDECGTGTTIHSYLVQATADIGALSGTTGSASSVQAAITMDSAVILDAADSSYRTRRVWIDTDGPQRWALATSGMWNAIPPGTRTFRLLVRHDHDQMTVKSFGSSLIVWDLGYWCSEP